MMFFVCKAMFFGKDGNKVSCCWCWSGNRLLLIDYRYHWHQVSLGTKGAKIQLLDLPGIIEGAKDGKGRGRQVIAGV